MSDTDARLIVLRYSTTCRGCASSLPPGTSAWWSRNAKATTCLACEIASVVPRETNVRTGVAGGSARREYERRSDRHRRRIQQQHPVIGSAILRWTREPSSVAAWQRGARGEELLGARLDRLHGPRMVVLHDRRLPKSRANIDHLVIGPSGVTVVDAKHYRGKMSKRDEGGWLRSDMRLHVGRRDVSGMMASVKRQVDAVGTILGGERVPVIPALCFVGAEWPLLMRPQQIDGVWVGWPRALAALVSGAGALDAMRVQRVARILDAGLRRY